VLIAFGPWPGADLELECAESSWSGLGTGYGYLVERELTITVRGRGVAARPISGRVMLPAAPDGTGYQNDSGTAAQTDFQEVEVG
jgi:hypothetical protein